MPQLEALLDRLQAVQGLTLPPGYNPKLRFMSHLWGELGTHKLALQNSAQSAGTAAPAAMGQHQ